jgi:predicted metalloprotease with PDZ domain
MNKYQILIAFLFTHLCFTSSSAQTGWSKTGYSQTKIYNSANFESYKFVGTVTYFGADFTFNKSGGIITQVHNSSPASDFNFKVNDVITSIGKFKISSADDYEKAMDFYKPKDEVYVSYKRDDDERSRIVILEKIDVYKSEKDGKKLQLPSSINEKGAPATIKVLETGKH